MKIDSQELPHIVVSACLEIHRVMGPHLLREAYLECLAHELRLREILFRQTVPVEINYKGRSVSKAFTFDFIVESMLILDVQAFPESDQATKEKLKERMRTMLRLSGFEAGFLINFQAQDIRHGIKRIIVSENEPQLHYVT